MHTNFPFHKPRPAGSLGTQLQEDAAKETASLNPPHQFVPWVVVQGVPLGDTFEQLKTYVCVSLKADNRFVKE